MNVDIAWILVVGIVAYQWGRWKERRPCEPPPQAPVEPPPAPLLVPAEDANLRIMAAASRGFLSGVYAGRERAFQEATAVRVN